MHELESVCNQWTSTLSSTTNVEFKDVKSTLSAIASEIQHASICQNTDDFSNVITRFHQRFYPEIIDVLLGNFIVDWIQVLETDDSLDLLYSIIIPIHANAKFNNSLSFRSFYCLFTQLKKSQNSESSKSKSDAREKYRIENVTRLLCLHNNAIKLSDFYDAISFLEKKDQMRSNTYGQIWSDFLQMCSSLPSIVANATEGRPPADFEESRFFNTKISNLVAWILNTTHPTSHLSSCWVSMIAKFLRIGQVDTFAHVIVNSLSFQIFEHNKPTTALLSVLTSLSLHELQSIFGAVIKYMHDRILASSSSSSEKARKIFKGVLANLVSPGSSSLKCLVTYCIGAGESKLRYQWDTQVAEIVACTIVEFGADAIESAFETGLKMWSDPSFAKLANVQNKKYLTTCLLLLLSHLPSDKQIELSRSPDLIRGVQTYMDAYLPNSSTGAFSNQDALISRDLALLLAECVSVRAHASCPEISPINFGISLHPLVENLREIATKTYDDDRISIDESDIKDCLDEDLSIGVPSLQNLANSKPSRAFAKLSNTGVTQVEVKKGKNAKEPNKKIALIQELDMSSSESDDGLPAYPMETDSDVDDNDDNADDGLDRRLHSKTRILPPVYICDLIDYLKSDDRDKISIALENAENLIRRKADFGTELKELSISLGCTLIGLQNNFEIAEFEEKLSKSLAALVVSCPVRIVGFLIDQFFSSSIGLAQRYHALGAVAVAARELAGLESHSTAPSFPSDMLSGSKHQRLLASNTLQDLSQDLTARLVRTTTKESARYNEFKRTSDKLKIDSLMTKSQAKDTSSNRSKTVSASSRPFVTIAWDVFVGPMLATWWKAFHDTAGDAPAFDPACLEKFINTLSIVLYCCANATNLRTIITESWDFVLHLKTHPHPSIQLAVLQGILCVFCVMEASTAEASYILASEYSGRLIESLSFAEGRFEDRTGEADMSSMRALAAALVVRITDIMENHKQMIMGLMY